MSDPRAGQPAQPSDLVDVAQLVDAYYAVQPDPAEPAQQVVFGTSGHRGSSFDAAFNEAHILATTQAICEYRAAQGYDGPLFVGRDTHGLSEPAWASALEVLAANDVTVLVDAARPATPRPPRSATRSSPPTAGKTGRAGRRHRGHARRTTRPATAASSTTRRTAARPTPTPPAGSPTAPTSCCAPGWTASAGSRSTGPAPPPARYDFLGAYVDDLPNVLDLDAIRDAGVRIGADPLGGASVDYWGAIAERHGLDLTVVNPLVDPTWRFMTLDWDGKIRMDCSSPSAMASLIGRQGRVRTSPRATTPTPTGTASSPPTAG